jgi:CHAT domain-containing protein/Tfp pilus assembly protein PilF
LARAALAVRERQLPPTDPQIAESLNTVGMILQESDFKGARPLLERALRIREQHYSPRHPAIAESLTNLSRTLYAGGEFRAARPLLERAISILEAAQGPTSPEVATNLIHLSIVVSQLGDLPRSRLLMERALAVLTPLEADYPLELAMGLNYYGNILRRQGDFVDARVPLERSLSIRENILGPSHPHVARTLSRMGMLEAVKGNHRAALPLFQRALQINEQALGPSHAEIAGDLNEIGSVQRALGNLSEARNAFERALRIQQATIGPSHPFVAVTLVALGQLAAQDNQADTAKGFFLQALDLQNRSLGVDHVFSTETLTALGYLEAQRGALKEAAAYFQRAARIKESNLGPAHPDLATSLFDVARVFHAQGNFPEARTQYERARKILLSHATLNATLDAASQSRLLGTQLKGLYDYELLLATIVGKPSQDSPHKPAMHDAFVVAEQARSWVVQTAVARAMARQSLVDQGQQRAVRKVDDLRRRREALWNELTELYSASPDDRQYEEIQKTKMDLDSTQRELNMAQSDVEALAPQYAQLAMPMPAGIDDIRALLDADEVVISWLTLPDRVMIWCLRAGSPPIYRQSLIPAAKVQDLVSRVRRSLTPSLDSRDKVVIPTFDVEAAFELYRLLIDPVFSYIQSHAGLILIPDKVLLALPFSALIMQRTDQAFVRLADNFNKKRHSEDELSLYQQLPWLISSHAITVMPSGSTLRLIRNAPRQSDINGESFLGFGDPLLQGRGTARGGAMPKERGTRALRDELTRLNRLPGTREELLAIARALSVPLEDHLFLSEQATETQINILNRSGRLGRARVLSFATHGLLAGELHGLTQPSLVFTPPDTPTDDDDGLVSLDDVLQLKLPHTDWVVLSACNTAGDDGSGESLSGLARAFFFAGAKGLLVSQWSVDDQATQALMTEIFTRYGKEHLAPAEALRQGMLAIMQEGAHNREKAYFAHPFAWAAFFLVGEGR